ncbi:protein of unknown function [Chryseobacterium taichungense]|uniref:Nucleotide modification associated domain-containing protein n=2 Tax=Chryseobacterium taichungense TaxID=295069 RepID=A0A1H7Y5C0_9FLAO|nr:protein of unknown function [Chryseobacterium taichungense]
MLKNSIIQNIYFSNTYTLLPYTLKLSGSKTLQHTKIRIFERLREFMSETSVQFEKIISQCRELFSKKLQDYGPAWRVLRPSSITDQIYIKINRIRTLQMTDKKMVDESEEGEFVAIINYSIIGLIQLEKGFSNDFNENNEEILKLYDQYATEARQLMERKNHDYGEAWRDMRISSITDLIYQKVLRTKQIEDNQGVTVVSEGLDANYFDMLNYSVFCLIKFSEQENKVESKN